MFFLVALSQVCAEMLRQLPGFSSLCQRWGISFRWVHSTRFHVFLASSKFSMLMFFEYLAVCS